MNHFPLRFVIGVLILQSAAACGATFDGFTEPFRKIEVAASETGTVAQLLVHEGDRVTKGQALATLDNDVLEVSREIAAANAQAKGKLDSAVAERELRKTRLERLEPLRAEGHASQEEIDRAGADLAVAEANLQAAREQHQLDELERKKIEAMIERRTLRSPIDGCVLKIQKEEREFVSANSAAVVTVVQLDPLRVVFSLPTAYAAKLSVGSAVDLELPESGAKAPRQGGIRRPRDRGRERHRPRESVDRQCPRRPIAAASAACSMPSTAKELPAVPGVQRGLDSEVGSFCRKGPDRGTRMASESARNQYRMPSMMPACVSTRRMHPPGKLARRRPSSTSCKRPRSAEDLPAACRTLANELQQFLGLRTSGRGASPPRPRALPRRGRLGSGGSRPPQRCCRVAWKR